MNRDEEKISMAVHKTADAVNDFATYLCIKQGFSPLELIAIFSIALVSVHANHLEKGKEDEAFNGLVEGLRVLHDDCVEHMAMHEAEEAKRDGKIQ